MALSSEARGARRPVLSLFTVNRLNRDYVMAETLDPVEHRWSPSVDESYLAALEARDPSVRAVARWFRADHMAQEALHGDVAREFQAFTLRLLDMIGDDSAEMVVALRKLLEAKDAAVRAVLS